MNPSGRDTLVTRPMIPFECRVEGQPHMACLYLAPGNPACQTIDETILGIRPRARD